MIKGGIHPRTLFRFKHLAECKAITHFISTRPGGVSPEPFDSLNLGFKTQDDPANVLKNRELVSSAVGIPLSDFIVGKQVHGDSIAVVTSEMKGRGALDYATALDATDGLVTDLPELCLMVLLADCVPILLYDPTHQAVGAVHSGWKGTVQRIGARAAEVMHATFGSDPKELIVGIGPSIGPCCYEVGGEVISQFEASFGVVEGLVDRRTSDGKGHLNLWEANRRLLLDAGVSPDNLKIARMCTRCNADLFFSERHRSGTGRFGVGIMLTDPICAECTSINCTWCRE